ncbi:MAG: hypothetical protein WCQ32_01295 [bacterium]
MANVNPRKVFQIQNDLAKVVLQKFEANDIKFFQELEGLVQKHAVPESIADKLARFGDIARSKGIKLYYDTTTGTDPDIMNRLPNAVVSLNPAPQGNWKKVDTQNGTTESKMLKTAIIMLLSCAVDTFIAELQKGTFDTLSTYRIIFLEEKDAQGRALKLVCNRDGDGRLRLYVLQVNPVNTWYVDGNAWLQQQ